MNTEPKKKLSCEMGASQEEHDVEGSPKILHRPFLRFTHGNLGDPDAFTSTFDCDSLFPSADIAYSYLKDILGTMTKPMSGYLDNFQLEKANGKTQDFRS